MPLTSDDLDVIERVLAWQQTFIDANPLYGLFDGVRERDLQEIGSALAAVRELHGEGDTGEVWQRVEYEHIFTPDAAPIRSDYEVICEDWYAFGSRSHSTSDGYEYAICRRRAILPAPQVTRPPDLYIDPDDVPAVKAGPDDPRTKREKIPPLKRRRPGQ